MQTKYFFESHLAPVITYTKRGTEAYFATLLYPDPDGNIPEISVFLENEAAKVTLGDESFTLEGSFDDNI